jgi:hypothetical protein
LTNLKKYVRTKSKKVRLKTKIKEAELSKNCGCNVKCDKHKKAPKDKCREYYGSGKMSDIMVFLMLGSVAVSSTLLFMDNWIGSVWGIGAAIIFTLFGVVATRRENAWRYKIHPQNLAEIERLERALYFNTKLQKKIKPGEGEEEQSRARAALDALRSRKLVEFEQEKKTSTSIYSDDMSELNAHLDVLDSILAGMRGPEKLCFSAAADINKNYILGEIRHLGYPYLEDMPDA